MKTVRLKFTDQSVARFLSRDMSRFLDIHEPEKIEGYITLSASEFVKKDGLIEMEVTRILDQGIKERR